MLTAQRVALLAAASLLILTACEGGMDSGTSSGSSSVSIPPAAGDSGGSDPGTGGFTGAAGGPAGTKDTVVVTPSVPGTIAVTAGSSQTVSLTFTSSDGRPMRGLELTGTTLPAAWSGTENYA